MASPKYFVARCWVEGTKICTGYVTAQGTISAQKKKAAALTRKQAMMACTKWGGCIEPFASLATYGVK